MPQKKKHIERKVILERRRRKHKRIIRLPSELQNTQQTRKKSILTMKLACTRRGECYTISRMMQNRMNLNKTIESGKHTKTQGIEGEE